MVSTCRPACVSRQTFKTSQGLCLIQDGAILIPHKRRTLSLLQTQRVNVLPWPSKSPDLNPIRMVRRRAKYKTIYNLLFVMDGWNGITCTHRMLNVCGM